MMKNVMVAEENISGEVQAYFWSTDMPINETSLLMLLDWSKDDNRFRENSCPQYTLDAPTGVGEFFASDWLEPEDELFMYCRTNEGWYCVYRNQYGQSPGVPLEKFVEFYDQWQNGDSELRFDQFLCELLVKAIAADS